jgi:N utilization substance protein B
MKDRTKAREKALQALYQMDLVEKGELEENLAEFLKGLTMGPRVKDYAEELVRGIFKRSEEVDGLIKEFSENWSLERMVVVDRNILRIAVYELVYCPDVPYKTIIDEAIELAKKFGTEDSGSFINGILDQVAKATRLAGHTPE